MTYIFHSLLCLVLVIVQTVVLPGFGGGGVYDLLLMFVFFLGLYRPAREAVPVIVILGFILDNLSGAPFGVYLTAYFWLFFSVRWITRFFRVRNLVLMPVIIASGILMKNVVFIGTVAMGLSWPEFHLGVAQKVGYQLLWALATGPVIIVFFSWLHTRWEQWLLRLADEQNGNTL